MCDVVSENVPGPQGAHITFVVAVPSQKIGNCHQFRYAMEEVGLGSRGNGALGNLEEVRDSVCTSIPSHHIHTHTHTHTPLGGLSLTNSSDFVFLGHHLTF